MPTLNVDLDYPCHPKTRRLVGLLGPIAEVYPIRLWCYAGKYFAKSGSFADHSAQELEAVLRWDGPSGELVGALIRVGFLVENNGCLNINDWDEHEGHIARYHERAKRMSRARWSSNATSNAVSNASRNTRAVQGSAGHIKIKNKSVRVPVRAFQKPTALEATAYAKGIGFDLDGEAFVAYYDARGWLYGYGKPMKDWKAAIVTWKKKHIEQTKGGQHGTNDSTGSDRVKAIWARVREARATQGLRKVTPAAAGAVLAGVRADAVDTPPVADARDRKPD